METAKYIVIREKTFQSLVQDAGSIGMVLFAFWFNYKFIGGNDALDILLFLLFFAFVIGRAAAIKTKLGVKIMEIDTAKLKEKK